jgi:hypothetical protein
VIASANAIGVTLNSILFGLKIKYTVQKWVEYYVDTLTVDEDSDEKDSV